MINDTAWSSCSPPGCLWLETNMCHYWWDYEWLNSQDLNKHRNISFQKKRAFSVRETRADFSALLVSHVTPPSSQSSSGKRWWWKTGLGSAGFCAGKGHSMVEKRDDRTMTEQWEKYPTDMTYIKVIILVFTHIYIQNLFLNPFVTLLGLPLHAAVESIAKHAIPSVGSGDQRLQNFTNLECHV